MPQYDQDTVFAPGEVIEPDGFTSQQQDTIQHPWDHVGEPNRKPINQELHHSAYNAVTKKIHEAGAVHMRSCPRILFTAVPLIGTVAGGDIPEAGPIKLVDSQVGRRFVIIKCPPSNTKGAYIGHNVDAVLTGFAWLVSPADPPLYLETEDSIWAMGITGTVVTDVIQAAVGIDPLSD